MVTELHITELLPAYSLDCLDEEETRLVSEHLARCATCRAELHTYQSVFDCLALAAPEAALPSGLKERLMERIESPRAAPVLPPRMPWWQQLAALFQRAAPVWSLASLLLIIALAVSSVWLWQRANQPGPVEAPAGWRVIAMAGTAAAPNATGTLVISHGGEYGTLVVDDLPALDAEHQYQLWLIRGGQRTSGGVFSVNAEGYGALWISSPEPLSTYPAFGITVEPAGGSSGPTGEKVLGGNL